MKDKLIVSKEFINKVTGDEYKDVIRLIISVIYAIPRFDIDYNDINVSVINNVIKIYYEDKEILSINTL